LKSNGAIMADYLTYPPLAHPPLAHPWAAARPSGAVAALMHLPRFWIERASWRNELMNLDARQMRDCGLDPVAVRHEALKPFWRD
jgi:uncharacterized protein YjiS (DUF1127 family)